ncbi:hypothetical protein SHLO109777_11575 [Shewanella loihica]
MAELDALSWQHDRRLCWVNYAIYSVFFNFFCSKPKKIVMLIDKRYRIVTSHLASCLYRLRKRQIKTRV